MEDNAQIVLDLFYSLSRIPRESTKEERIRDWIVSWAGDHGYGAKTDSAGNVVVNVPASPGLESAPVLVLQGHMDMVCEKMPDSKHDFSRDPIVPHVEGEWLTADRTTLGADNGIGIALALAAASSSDVLHPRLELLFTVDEETGLIGATNLSPDIVTGRVLINVDSEDEGVFTVGCAGGQNTFFDMPIAFEKVDGGAEAIEVVVSGLRGGHSGVEIHEGRGNANGLLGRIVARCIERYNVRLASFAGGSAHNAIPRDARAILVPSDQNHAADFVTSVAREVEELAAAFKNELRGIEPRLAVSANRVASPDLALDTASTRKVADLICALPHGVLRMSSQLPKLVQTSTNFAKAVTEMDKAASAGTLSVLTSQRSLLMSELDAASGAVAAAARLAGATVRFESWYPSWEPNTTSPLLARAKTLYRELFGRDPVVEVIHAGLECGVIGSKIPGMDMISLGPTIKGAHSPEERLYLPSLEKVWRLLRAMLKSWAR